MSYDNMDHADWAERNIAAGKRSTTKRRKDNKKGYAAAPDVLNPFQRKVMHILGVVGGGIYNAPIAWEAIDWLCGTGMLVPWRRELATFDYRGLTDLVFLCHMARIRCCVAPHSPGHLSLMFHPREPDGGMGRRHPDLDEAIAQINERFPANHPIRFAGARGAETMELECV